MHARVQHMLCIMVHAVLIYQSFTYAVLKFRQNLNVVMLRGFYLRTAYAANTNGPILAAIMSALSFHSVAAMAVAGMRVCHA